MKTTRASATYRLNLPIEGVQFSNNQVEITFEVEGDDAQKLLDEVKDRVRSLTDELAEETSTKFATVIQEQNRKLEAAREKVLELMEENKMLKNGQ